MHGVVFAIHGSSSRPLSWLRHHQSAGCDQNFFVRKRYRFSELYRFVGRFQPDNTHRPPETTMSA